MSCGTASDTCRGLSAIFSHPPAGFDAIPVAAGSVRRIRGRDHAHFIHRFFPSEIGLQVHSRGSRPLRTASASPGNCRTPSARPMDWAKLRSRQSRLAREFLAAIVEPQLVYAPLLADSAWRRLHHADPPRFAFRKLKHSPHARLETLGPAHVDGIGQSLVAGRLEAHQNLVRGVGIRNPGHGENRFAGRHLGLDHAGDAVSEAVLAQEVILRRDPQRRPVGKPHQPPAVRIHVPVQDRRPGSHRVEHHQRRQQRSRFAQRQSQRQRKERQAGNQEARSDIGEVGRKHQRSRQQQPPSRLIPQRDQRHGQQQKCRSDDPVDILPADGRLQRQQSAGSASRSVRRNSA